jgi:site-specific DNA-methyltransferase (adenine-specific)/modification methylase
MSAPEKIVIGNAEVWHGDCREVLPTLQGVDAVVTDPPYGIGESAGKAKTRTSGLGGKLKNAQLYRKDYGDDAWDDKPIDDDLILMVRQAAKWAVIFGGNYYALPPAKCWLVWDKENGDTDFADAELAWTNLPKAVRLKRYLWNGCMRANGEKRGDHPTQKPVGVMAWAINHVPAPNRTILDPFMGSGTTGVACMNLGRRFIGIELERKYFDIAVRRIEDAQRQERMFA